MDSNDLNLAPTNTSESINVSLSQLLNSFLPDANGVVKVIIDNKDTPLEVHFTGTVGITSDKNLMVATPNGMTNLNPVSLDTEEVIDIANLDSYSEMQQKALEIQAKEEENTECLLHDNHLSYEDLLLKVKRLEDLSQILIRHMPQSLLLEKELKCLV